MIWPIKSLVIPAGCPATAGRRAGTYTRAARQNAPQAFAAMRQGSSYWVPDLRPAQGRASVRDDKVNLAASGKRATP